MENQLSKNAACNRWLAIPEDGNIHEYCRENLISYINKE
jgi:hypothetical protein